MKKKLLFRDLSFFAIMAILAIVLWKNVDRNWRRINRNMGLQISRLLTIPHWIFFSWGFTFMAFHSVYLNLKR